MISQMLNNESMLEFVTAFETLPVFSPFHCLLNLKKVRGVYQIWPIWIDSSLSPEECFLVHEASFLSPSVHFDGKCDMTAILKECRISQTHKSKMELTGFNFSGELLNELQQLPVSVLYLHNSYTREPITESNWAYALGQNPYLKSLILNFCRMDSSPLFRQRLFESVADLKNLTSFTWMGYHSTLLSQEEGQILGDSLKSTNITDLRLMNVTWHGLKELTERLHHTKVERLQTRPYADQYSEDIAQIILANISKSKVKHLTITSSKLPDSFATLLSTTKNLHLQSIQLQINNFSIMGIAALLKMNMSSLIFLNLSWNIRSEAEAEILKTLKPPRLRLLLLLL